MQTHDTLFTPTEAAVLTGLPLKAVNNAIDKKTISAVAGEEARAGCSTRGRSCRCPSSAALPIASRPNCGARCSMPWPMPRATSCRSRAG